MNRNSKEKKSKEQKLNPIIVVALINGVRGIQNHDQRIKESYTNSDIDLKKSNLNEDLHKQDLNKTYYVRIKNRINQLKLSKVPRKDAVVMCEFIVTSDKGFFEEMPKAEQNKFFKESLDFIRSRYGEENLVHATVHYDESTPHLHVGIVPVTKDNKLSCYQIFDKLELRGLQEDFNKHINNKGFKLERGESRENKHRHVDMQKFKAETLKERIKNLEHGCQAYEREINAIQNALKALKSDFNKATLTKGKHR